MSAALVPPFEPVEAPRRKRFTRQEFERLMETGVFEGQRWELIDGDLIDKMGQNPPHSFAIQLLFDLLAAVFGISRLRVQSPIELSLEDQERSLPEPDLVLLIERKPEYGKRHPRADEVLLVIEVSDTTARFDLFRKAALYARAGVREYWVLDLTSRRLIVHRQPDGSMYRLTQIFSEADSVSLEGRAEALAVREMFPEA
jgi:Uma2 family endonuclease